MSEHREKFLEERQGPTDFRQEEDDNLSDNQKTIEGGPEHAGGLIGNSRVGDVIVTGGGRVVRRATGIVLIGVESLDVVDECQNTA